jgi:type IV pilus assembly protein PilX
MNSGGSLPGLLFGLALGASVILMALERYQSLVSGLMVVREPLALRQQARLALFELGRDLRMHGQAGCASLPVPSPAQGSIARIEYMEPDWSIHKSVTDAGKQHLLALWLLPPADFRTSSGLMVLSSCHHAEPLAGSMLAPAAGPAGLMYLPFPDQPLLGGDQGHHFASLAVGPVMVREYRVGTDAGGKGVLLRRSNSQAEQQMLTRVHAFSVIELTPGLIQVELSFGSEPVPWKMLVARRQRGLAQVMVMALMLAGMLLLATTQRLLLDERQLQQQHEQWWQTLQYAEAGLRNAERVVLRVPGRRVSSAAFVDACLEPRPSGLKHKTGRCLSSGASGFRDAAYLRELRLQPCRNTWCTELPLAQHPGAGEWPASGATKKPVRVRGKGGRRPALKPANAPNYCPADPLAGPFNPRPCYIVELLDRQYQDGALYRITVRAWGWSTRTRVTLQSYYAVGAAGRRLGWLELP